MGLIGVVGRAAVTAGPLAAVLVGVPLAVGRSLGASSTAGGEPPPVEQVFLRDCATCHGAHLEGTDDGPALTAAGPALLDYELSTGRMPLPDPDAEVVRRHPAYDRNTMDALIEHIVALGATGEAVPHLDLAGADVARGGEQFRANCAACHQAAGQGGALRYGEAPALHASTPLQVAEATRTGPGTMPVFPAAGLTDADLSAIARYVQELQHAEDPGGQPLWHLGPLAEGLVAFVVVVLLAGALALIGERR